MSFAVLEDRQALLGRILGMRPFLLLIYAHLQPESILYRCLIFIGTILAYSESDIRVGGFLTEPIYISRMG